MERVDRGILGLMILVHIITFSEFVRNELLHLVPEAILAVVYIIMISGFWLWFMKKKFSEEKQKLVLENNKSIGRINNYENLLKDLEKYKQYTNSYRNIASGFSEIHQLQRYINNANPKAANVEQVGELMLEYFGRFCDHIVRAFENIYCRKDVSVCIKIIHGPANKTSERSSVKTLIRDLNNYDERDKDSDILHSIEENTSYLSILKNIKKKETQRNFLNNNLPLLREYKNTSNKIYGQVEYPNDMPDTERIVNWKLPYKSTIVTGICPTTSNYNQMKNLIGYICIDTVEPTNFNEDFDCRIFNGIADGLYNVLKDYKKFIKEATDYKKNSK